MPDQKKYPQLFFFIFAVSKAIELKVIHMNGLRKEACKELCRKQNEPLCQRVEFSKNRCVLHKSTGRHFLSTTTPKCSRELRKWKCPNGYQYMYPCGRLVEDLCMPSCYSVSKVLSFPLGAAHTCQHTGGELLSIETPGEQNHLEKMLKLERQENSNLEVEGYWTSGTDFGREGHWVWASTGQNFMYTNWDTGEPK